MTTPETDWSTIEAGRDLGCALIDLLEKRTDSPAKALVPLAFALAATMVSLHGLAMQQRRDFSRDLVIETAKQSFDGLVAQILQLYATASQAASRESSARAPTAARCEPGRRPSGRDGIATGEPGVPD